MVKSSKPIVQDRRAQLIKRAIALATKALGRSASLVAAWRAGSRADVDLEVVTRLLLVGELSDERMADLKKVVAASPRY
jgi:hypothetical protein